MPLEDRVALLEKLINQRSGLAVVFGNNQLSGSIIVQINQMQPEQLDLILNALASRIRRENL